MLIAGVIYYKGKLSTETLWVAQRASATSALPNKVNKNMENLLKETKNILKENNKSLKDILWCGSDSFGFFTIEDFEELAYVEYDSGFGSPKVAEDLILCGKDFWLERHEYDGAENWEYKSIPIKPSNYTKPTALTTEEADKLGYDVSIGWNDLKKLNNITNLLA